MLSATAKTSKWVRAPKQARSSATLERILQGAERLLADRDFEDVTIADLVGAAGISVGAFYKRFASKEAVLPCLIDRYYDELAASASSDLVDEGRWKGASLEERAKAIVAFGIAGCRSKKGLMRAIVARNHRLGSKVPEDNRRVVKGVLEGLVAMFLPCAGEIDHPDPERAVRFAILNLITSLHELLLFGDGTTAQVVTVSDDELAEELVRSFTRYLVGR